MDYPMPGGYQPRPTYLPQPTYQQPIYQPPMYQQQPAPQQGFQCRPVTSREEAVAVQVDFASPGTLLPDFAHGTIYFKRFNSNTGASDFLTYALQTDPPAAPAPTWASAQEVEELRAAVARLSEKLRQMEGRADEPVE